MGTDGFREWMADSRGEPTSVRVARVGVGITRPAACLSDPKRFRKGR